MSTGTPSAQRDVRPAFTLKEAELIIWRMEREMKLVQVQMHREGRTQTDDERSNLRRYRRIIEQLEQAMLYADDPAPSAPTRPSDPAGGETARFTTEEP